MSQSITHLTLLVRNYDEALQFFTQKLSFRLIQDTPLPDNKRWLLVAPPDSRGAALLLAEADTPEQSLAIGNQSGGRVFLFLHTDDFWRDYKAYQSRGVRFLESPREESYGTVAVFEDLYGNKWDLLQPAAPDERAAVGD
ncbi:MAG TPA: VOC family protein [Candidatus Acidoferrales bacterium]|jgi:catechol 2,3-dioxygenase-like lactoylglutathione lyase family enzyme|nr:VOC family protein [Candidatus Acidoferrales bacterium]